MIKNINAKLNVDAYIIIYLFQYIHVYNTYKLMLGNKSLYMSGHKIHQCYQCMVHVGFSSSCACIYKFNQ